MTIVGRFGRRQVIDPTEARFIEECLRNKEEAEQQRRNIPDILIPHMRPGAFESNSPPQPPSQAPLNAEDHFAKSLERYYERKRPLGGYEYGRKSPQSNVTGPMRRTSYPFDYPQYQNDRSSPYERCEQPNFSRHHQPHSYRRRAPSSRVVISGTTNISRSIDEHFARSLPSTSGGRSGSQRASFESTTSTVSSGYGEYRRSVSRERSVVSQQPSKYYPDHSQQRSPNSSDSSSFCFSRSRSGSYERLHPVHNRSPQHESPEPKEHSPEPAIESITSPQNLPSTTRESPEKECLSTPPTRIFSASEIPTDASISPKDTDDSQVPKSYNCSPKSHTSSPKVAQLTSPSKAKDTSESGFGGRYSFCDKLTKPSSGSTSGAKRVIDIRTLCS
eukprot:Nk52_evm96s2192 gene=Nk52_evmTU96s2192